MFKLHFNFTCTVYHSLTRKMSTNKDVLFETLNNAGVITLNRPKALNATNTTIVTEILPKLEQWENDKKLVIIKGNGEKAFCAGGDVKAAIDKVQGPVFFRTEYNTIYKIANLKIPYVSLIHGITMGGGLGLSVHGRYRVATEKTMIAMPETKIGLYPDVGGTYFLPRLQVNLGYYLGLTGDQLKGTDVLQCGIATHFVPSKRLYELEMLLSRCQNDAEINALLCKFHEPSSEGFSLSDNIKHIKYCFAASTMEEIIQRLEKVQNEWSKKTLKTLSLMCPGSLKITLRALQRGAQLSLGQCLQMEYRISCHSVQEHDFAEGVRALLIEKDNNPQWKHACLAAVTDDYVEWFFKKLPEDEELKFYSSSQV